MISSSALPIPPLSISSSSSCLLLIPSLPRIICPFDPGERANPPLQVTVNQSFDRLVAKRKNSFHCQLDENPYLLTPENAEFTGFSQQSNTHSTFLECHLYIVGCRCRGNVL
ncbi:hypothetical protein Salat_1621900 [Sesamum alatum]|uniref:Uncharacterized protein n=1 Tax=Sesamum alatum TaxID=300844 RepID=A0AAE1Y5T4_9LAMI|nr:hypothetical protein Salat_1621900 [Sesamum alatum]